MEVNKGGKSVIFQSLINDFRYHYEVDLRLLMITRVSSLTHT